MQPSVHTIIPSSVATYLKATRKSDTQRATLTRVQIARTVLPDSLSRLLSAHHLAGVFSLPSAGCDWQLNCLQKM